MMQIKQRFEFKRNFKQNFQIVDQIFAFNVRDFVSRMRCAKISFIIFQKNTHDNFKKIEQKRLH